MIKSFFNRFDLFPAQVSLRNKGGAAVRNPYTGFFSFLLDGIFYYLVISALVNLISLNSITAQQTIKSNRNVTNLIQNVSLGFGIQFKNLSSLRHILQLRAFMSGFSGNIYEINVQPCSRQYWKEVDEIRYSSLNIGNGMCLQKNQSYIKGISGLSGSQFIAISLSVCNNATSPVPCASQADIDAFFLLHSDPIRGNSLPISLYIMDVELSPFSQEPIQHSIYQKSLWLFGSYNQEAIVQTFIGNFKITTDTSFMPWNTIDTKAGYYTVEVITNTVVKITPSPLLAQAFILGAPTQMAISRSYGKFTVVLGFAGGLIALLTNFFSISIGSFNRYRYQISIGQGVFRHQKEVVREENFTFLKYLKYSIYDWGKNVFCCKFEWEDCQAIQLARKQAAQQIQIPLIIRRLSHLEKISEATASKELSSIMELMDLDSLQQVKKRRLVTQYSSKFVQRIDYTTIDLFQQSQNKQGLTTQNQLNMNGSIEPNESQLFDKNIENKFPQSDSSLKQMTQYVKKFIKKFNINENTYNLSEEDIMIQQQLAINFYQVDQQTRKKLIKRIPLGILYRFCLSKTKTKNQVYPEQLIVPPIELGSINNTNKIQYKKPK